MGLFDTILGRTRAARPDLDALFALPGAALTLEASAGLVPSGRAGVCFRAPAGKPFEELEVEVESLLGLADTDPTTSGDPPAPAQTVRHVADSFGYRWIVIEGGGIDDLVTRAHLVHSSLEDAGWGPQLLCSVFGFHPGRDPGADPDALGPEGMAPDQPLFLVYLAKRGTFYPFAPSGPEERDSELELRIRGVLGKDLPVEEDLSRWFPLWDLPLTGP